MAPYIREIFDIKRFKISTDFSWFCWLAYNLRLCWTTLVVPSCVLSFTWTRSSIFPIHITCNSNPLFINRSVTAYLGLCLKQNDRFFGYSFAPWNRVNYHWFGCGDYSFHYSYFELFIWPYIVIVCQRNELCCSCSSLV